MKAIIADGLTKPAEVDFNIAYSGGKLLLPDWEYPVVLDLATTTVHKSIPILLYHNGTRRVGTIIESKVETNRISLKGIIIRALPDAKTVLDVHEGGGTWECSVGTAPVEAKNFELISTGSYNINEQTVEAPFYLLRNVEVREVSFVSAGADARTSVEIRASLLSTKKETSIMEDEKFLAFVDSLGLNIETLDEENKKNLYAAWQLKNEAEAAPAETPAVEAEGTESADEQKKEEDDEEKKDVKASALSEAHSRLAAMLNVNRPSCSSYKRPTEVRIIEASMLMSGGASGESVEKVGYTQAEINEATSREYRNIGLHSIMRRGIEASGLSLSRDCSSRELVQIYHTAINAAGLSTRDFAPDGIMSNVADKILRIQADQLSTVADKIFWQRSVKDFNKVVSGKLNMLGDIPEVLRGEDFENVGLSDNSQDYAIAKRGRNLTITIEDQINDDLGAFSQALQTFGRRFANTIDKVAIGSLVAQSSTLFTGNQKKTLSFSAANLKTVATAFQRIKGADGEFRNLIPGAILAGPEIANEARALFVFNDKSSIAPASSTEVMTSAYNVLSTPYIASNGGWYLLPRDEYIGEIASLNGDFAPKVERAALNTKNLNIEFLVWGTSGVLIYNDAPAVWSCPT